MAVKSLVPAMRPSRNRLERPEQSESRGARVQRVTYADLTWIDIVQPTPDALNQLRAEYQFHALALEDCLSKVQRPKLDDYGEDGYLFLVFHFPLFSKEARHTDPSEVDIFVGDNYVVTIHDGRLKPLVQLFGATLDEDGVRGRIMSRGSGFLLYRIVDRLVQYNFPMLNKLDELIERIESRIFENDVRNLVMDLSFVRRDIIALRRIIRPNLPVMRQLENRERAFLRLDEDIYFGDITDHLNKQWDMLEDDKDVIEGLNYTLDSLSSHRLNEVMKILTVISVLLLPMTLVASIYGMNIALPFETHAFAFPIVVALMLLAAVAMLIYFRFRGWV